jgi:hypothetical protein
MKVILIGYPGSQKAARMAKWLNGKYLSDDFEYTYLNYTGPIEGWSKYLIGYLSYLQDERIVFALDDYLVCEEMKHYEFFKAENEMVAVGAVVVKLCHASIEENEEYPVTTQYCLWDRKYLIWLLEQVNTPWEFEIRGSKLFNSTILHRPCIKYFTNSSVSGRWEGIRLDGLCNEDIAYIKEKF